jgi:hypothetical protein
VCENEISVGVHQCDVLLAVLCDGTRCIAAAWDLLRGSDSSIWQMFEASIWSAAATRPDGSTGGSQLFQQVHVFRARCIAPRCKAQGGLCAVLRSWLSLSCRTADAFFAMLIVQRWHVMALNLQV